MTAPSPAARRIDALLIAPGATRGERIAGYGTGLAGAAFAAGLAGRAGLPLWASAVVALLAFDLFGGAVVNATGSAKRHWHRPGRTARHHFGFVAGHVQPFVLAAVVPELGWATAAAVYGLAVGGALAVLAAPPPLRRPVAFAAVVLGLAVAGTLLPVPREVAWFAPVLLVKLLPAHLLPEEHGPVAAPPRG